MSPPQARRLQIAGAVSPVALRDEVRDRAAELGLMGWIRLQDDDTLAAHVEGDPKAIQALAEGLASVEAGREISQAPAGVEGHEQFMVRGLSAGVFVVQEHQATAHHFDVRLELDGRMRSWAVPKGPSMDPAAKRLAVQVEDHALAHNEFEGRTASGGVIIWDRGTYEQGGRVPWPAALERGHAVFVLHGQKLRGGFALQRTGADGKPQWLLIKRRDEYARPGSDIVGEQPRSVQSNLTLGELIDG